MLALYTFYSAVLVSGIASAIFTDEILRKHYFSILYICACFFFAFCIITLSRHCKPRRKTGAILEPAPTLSDSDLESDDELVSPEIASNLERLKSFTVFCLKRPMYVIAVFSCPVLWIIYRFLTGLFDTEEDFRIGSDEWAAETLLISMSIIVIIVVSIVASFEEYEPNSTKFSYEPFDENIEIPMKVYAPKMVAVLMTGQFNISVGLLVQLVLIILLAIISELPEHVMKVSKKHHTRLISMMTCFNFAMLFCIIKRFLKAHETTKIYLLGTFEKNWQQNLKACEFLLPEIEVNTLEDLRLALLEKINDPQLTIEEKKVFDYLKTPLWKTKRSFVDTPEDVYLAEYRTPPRPRAQRPRAQTPPRPRAQTPPRPRAESPPRPRAQTPPRPQDPALESNGSPSPKISPPVTRSRAKRQK